jgi:hypothetical protein
LVSLINSAWLILGCLGLGGLVAAAVRLPERQASPYLYLTAGAVLLYALALLGVPLAALAWLVYGGAAGALVLLYLRRRLVAWPRAGVYALLLLLLIPEIISTLYHPVRFWDARSIWFYQGKLLFFDHDLYSGNFPPPFCPHPDYPKFIPVFSALSATLAGLWNEYLVKAALMVPLAAMWLGVAGLSLRLWAKAAILIALVVLTVGSNHGGMMDGWVVVFCALGHLHFIDYGLNGRRASLAQALVSLIFVTYFKNEGLVLAGISLATMALAARLLGLRPGLRGGLPLLLLVGLAVVPVVVWRVYVPLTGLHNDLFVGDVAGRIGQALDSGAPLVIWRALFLQLGVIWVWCASLLFVGGCWLLGRFLRCPFALTGRQYLLLLAPWLTSLVYAAAIFAIYLLTPSDLEWHLATSAGRVMLPCSVLPVLTMLLAIFLPLENPRARRAQEAGAA